MSKIPTAEQLIDSRYPDFEALDSGNIWSNIEELMIEFAKLHVKQALEAATKELPYDDRCNQDHMLKQSILNAYPESNIK